MTLERYERATEWPLTASAVAFLVAYAWPILDQDLSSGMTAALEIVTTVVWLLFGLDYSLRVYFAPSSWAFIRGHPLDLVVLALPVLRPLRALRVLPVLLRLNDRFAVSFRGQVATYVAGAVSLVVFIAALAVLDAERGAADANISDFGDAVWWAATTVTTVGYGDQFPVTSEGRWVAAGLMLAGIALLGVVTATLAAWFVERLGQVHAVNTETRSDVSELTEEVRRLRAELERTRHTRH